MRRILATTAVVLALATTVLVTAAQTANAQDPERVCGNANTTFYDDGSCATSALWRIMSRQSSLYCLNNPTSCVRYG